MKRIRQLLAGAGIVAASVLVPTTAHAADAPFVARNDTFTVQCGSSLVIGIDDVLANDTWPDTGVPRLAGYTRTRNGTLEDIIIPTLGWLYTPAVGPNGRCREGDSFTYRLYLYTGDPGNYPTSNVAKVRIRIENPRPHH
jgi:hypothetical protein